MKIPSGWVLKTLDEVTEKITCGLAATPNYVSKEEGIAFLSAQNVQAGKLCLEKYKYIPKELHGRITKNTKPEYGDILYTRVGAGIGQAAVIDIEMDFSIYVSLTLLKCGKDLNNYFLKHLLNSSYYQFLAKREQFSGGGVQNLNVQVVKNFPILLPPIEQQKKIAEILATWDEAIALTEKAINARKQLKKALMKKIFTAKNRLPEFKESIWETKNLSEIAYLTMGTSPASEFYNTEKKGLPLVQGMSSITDGYAKSNIWTTQITQKALPNDILLSVRAPVGAISKTNQEICIGRGIASIRAKKGFSQEFIFQVLQFLEPKWVKLTRGSTFGAVTSIEIKGFSILVPGSYEEQCKIAHILSECDKEINLTIKLHGYLSQQKRGLMQKLLTGEWPVIVTETND